jgi:hypothetical protein
MICSYMALFIIIKHKLGKSSGQGKNLYFWQGSQFKNKYLINFQAPLHQSKDPDDTLMPAFGYSPGLMLEIPLQSHAPGPDGQRLDGHRQTRMLVIASEDYAVPAAA